MGLISATLAALCSFGLATAAGAHQADFYGSGERSQLTFAAKPSSTASVVRSYAHRGQAVGDPASSIEFDLSTLRPDGYLLKKIRAIQVKGICDGNADRVDLFISGQLRVENDGGFERRIPNEGGGGDLVLRGQITRRGREVSGQIKTGKFDNGLSTCSVPTFQFQTQGQLKPQCGSVGRIRKAKVCVITTFDHGRLKDVRLLTFNGLPVGCSDGSVRPVAGRATAVRVLRGGRFQLKRGEISGPFTDEHVAIVGRFGSSVSAEGTVKVSFVDGRGVRCRSGALQWSLP